MIRTGLLIVAILLAPGCPLMAADGDEVSPLARRTRSCIAIITATICCPNGIGANAACRIFILSQSRPEALVEPNRALGNEQQENTSAIAHGCRLDRTVPVAMRLRDLGGVGLRNIAHGHAPTDAAGANNLGLTVRVCGRVTSVGNNYIYIDDGSALIDGTCADGKQNVGVRVICCNASNYKPGDYVSVTGISSYFETANGGLARCVRTRSPEDTLILQVALQAPHQPQYGFMTPFGLKPRGLKTTASTAK